MTILKEGSSSRPFIGMKAVIIGANEDVVQSLTRVVRSGGGSVLPIWWVDFDFRHWYVVLRALFGCLVWSFNRTYINFHSSCSSDILSCTHCLSKSSKLELVPVPLNQLSSKKIHCVPAVYLSDYLMNDPPPDVRTCYFDQYKRLFKMLWILTSIETFFFLYLVCEIMIVRINERIF